MITRPQVVAEARTWLGTPYHHQARVKGAGVDCAGLVIGVARALGIVNADFDVNGYGRHPDGRALVQHCCDWMQQIPLIDMGVGDVMVVRFHRDPQHIGIVGNHVQGLSIIHALGTADGLGRVIEHRLDDTTYRRFVAAFRMPGVA